MESRADYNNNPGNLRPPKDVTYEGQIGLDDKGFAIFETPAAGERALKNDIKIKIEKGVNTPEKFIDMYAPKGKDAYGDENSDEARENYKIWLAHKLGLKSTTDPFPENAVDGLFGAIKDFEGGTWNKPAEEGQRLASQNTADIPGYSEGIEPFLGIVGAGIGLSAAGALETGKKVAPLIPNVLSRLGSGAPSPTQPMSRVGLQRYLNSQIAPNLRLPLSELEKVTGGEKIRTMSEVQNALTAVKGTPGERVSKTASIDPRTGTPRKVYSYTPGTPAIDLTPYEVAPKGPLASSVGRQISTAADVARAVAPSVARVGLGGLGGASAVMSGYDAAEMYRKMKEQQLRGEEPSFAQKARLASKSAATLGGGLSVLPFGVTQIPGLVLSAPETAWSLLDYYRNTPPAAEGALPQENVYP